MPARNQSPVAPAAGIEVGDLSTTSTASAVVTISDNLQLKASLGRTRWNDDRMDAKNRGRFYFVADVTDRNGESLGTVEGELPNGCAEHLAAIVPALLNHALQVGFFPESGIDAVCEASPLTLVKS